MMARLHHRTLAAIWLILVVATLASLMTSRSSGNAGALAAVAIIGLIYVKCRLVLFGFMEVGKGSRQWRLFFETWLAAVAGVIGYFQL